MVYRRFAEIIPNSSESESQEAITLSDGRIMILADYNKMVAETKPRNNVIASSPNIQPRMEVPALVKYATPTNQSAKSKPNRQPSNRGKARRNVARINQQQQRFVNQQQMKMMNQPQQKHGIAQNQFVQVQPQQQQQQHIQHQQAPVRHQQLSQQPQQQQQLQQQQQPPPPPPQQQQHQTVQQSYVQPQFVIHPPSQHQQHNQCPLPSYVASSQIQQIIENTPVSEEYSDSIRMLVLLENGEQRLITFTLPKEVCTIQEILEQVGVPFHPDTRIECTETNHSGINYLVTVGTHHYENNTQEEMYDTAEEANSQPNVQKSDASTMSESSSGEIATPEPTTEIETPRYVPGLLAVCNHCGYSSENFNRCLRCRFKLPEDVKTRPVLNNNNANNKKSDLIKTLPTVQDKKPSPKNNITNKLGAQKRKKPKLVEPEPVVLTLSSDDEQEESESNSKLSETDQLIRRLNNSAVTLSAIKKEPSMSDIQQNSVDMDSGTAVKGGGKDDSIDSVDLTTTLFCRTIRIGSYRYIPIENLIIKSSGIILKVPTPKDPNDIKTIVIERKHMVKVLVNFQKALPVVFYYVVPSVGHLVREQLGMIEGSELYFDPLSKEEAYKRITVLPENVTEETKTVFKHIYGKPVNIMDELTTKEANDILVKTCPRELSKVIASSGYTEIKQLLIYPPGKGGLPINTEDYLCLAQDQFLNDVIIDFYLKYLLLNLPKEKQEKIHIFSTFFYKRLTTKPVKASRRSHPAELDPTLTPAQKRHARVEKWTKNVNLFEKDFVIIPINENCHWFLAIVCFPGMDGCQTMEGKPVHIEPKRKKAIKKEKDEKAIPCDDGDISDRDEAEGDDSELDTDEEESESAESSQNEKSEVLKDQPIKQPCILIFDSLAGASRARVVATLRDYLTCEYKAKLGKERIFNKDVIKGCCPKIPQQTNFTDCGLYLLQYVEEFFKQPLKDYRIPMKLLKEWFEESVVTRKREDISLLIKELMIKYNKDPTILPHIVLPTLNGKEIVRCPEDEDDEFMDDFEEEEEEFPEDGEGDTSDMFNETFNSDAQMEVDNPTDSSSSHICITLNHSVQKDENSEEHNTTPKPSENVQLCDGFVEQPITNVSTLKPSLSETQKQSSREALSYLKSKRINRHKNVDAMDIKKFKSSTE
ncbi:hypothetical protein ILUMI_08881 [Ignelater luminosus]|uniref:Ubiquitin-like protease family profile domain-containing protein n=1 Tax=Ignelater luminosus TaxID=2038154 RepID=A0A8K0D4Y2_IGNLU|nr:hypothetical protein ILUMI_08881 [Ignelater luminosus]